jgi:hypothetical protein
MTPHLLSQRSSCTPGRSFGLERWMVRLDDCMLPWLGLIGVWVMAFGHAFSLYGVVQWSRRL